MQLKRIFYCVNIVFWRKNFTFTVFDLFLFCFDFLLRTGWSSVRSAFESFWISRALKSKQKQNEIFFKVWNSLTNCKALWKVRLIYVVFLMNFKAWVLFFPKQGDLRYYFRNNGQLDTLSTYFPHQSFQADRVI